jgi:environmental stress-induced protein Ves
MSFATEWHAQKKSRKLDVRHTFAAMTLYLEDKEAFFDAVIQEVYNSLPTQEYKNTIKEAMTALGFGAKLSMGTWRSDTGEENQSSLFEVFDRDIVVLKRFVECNLVKTYNSEQQALNKFIVAKFSGDAQWQAEMTAEQQRKKVKLFSSAQKIVWLYQHAETIMMDMVRAEAKKSGNTVLANVHDAVVVRNQIPAKLLDKIERKVQVRTGVGYFRLGETWY